MRIPFRPVLVDLLLAIALAALTVFALAEYDDGPVDPVAAVLAVLTVVPLAFRQVAPVLTIATMLAAQVTYTLAGHGEYPDGGVATMIAMFTVATLRPYRIVGAAYLAVLGVVAFVGFTVAGLSGWPQVVQFALVMAAVCAVGESTKKWVARIEQLATKAADAAAAERVRIARELHDIVAHHMSVISLQAGLAGYVLDTDPATAKKAIATVGAASREAVTDMRRLLEVLRVDDDTDYRPQPGLAMVDELVERLGTAGLTVEVTTTGSVRPLPPGVDLCAYRVIQEALTNVLKHAGPASARVEITYGEHTLSVRVTDDGTKPAGRAGSGSHGIRGMRERAELYGGVLTAEPARDGGFVVLLRLPIEESR